MTHTSLFPMSVLYKPIGIITSGHLFAVKTPIQPVYARGCPGRVELFPEYADGLRDLEGFSHLHLIYHFHKADPAQLLVRPFTHPEQRGVFATRHPARPNSIGLSIVRLVRIDGLFLYLEDVDILDGTPLLDIKPFIPRFDWVENATPGWTACVGDEEARQLGLRQFAGQDAACE